MKVRVVRSTVGYDVKLSGGHVVRGNKLNKIPAEFSDDKIIDRNIKAGIWEGELFEAPKAKTESKPAPKKESKPKPEPKPDPEPKKEEAPKEEKPAPKKKVSKKSPKKEEKKAD